jgi:translation elongation factor EF-Tu-like GTPase
MATSPIITAEVVLLTTEDGGRSRGIDQGYVPHIVVQSRTIRAATYDERGWGNEEYLGVRFVHCPSEYNAGESGMFKMELMYHPRVNYSKAVPGAEFTIREGGRIVGHGQITARDDTPVC